MESTIVLHGLALTQNREVAPELFSARGIDGMLRLHDGTYFKGYIVGHHRNRKGEKWLGEDTQQYRPKRKKAEPDYYCESHGHKYEDGVCTRCDDPEIDEMAAVECEFCREVFAATGFKECPMHEAHFHLPDMPKMALLEAGA